MTEDDMMKELMRPGAIIPVSKEDLQRRIYASSNPNVLGTFGAGKQLMQNRVVLHIDEVSNGTLITAIRNESSVQRIVPHDADLGAEVCAAIATLSLEEK